MLSFTKLNWTAKLWFHHVTSYLVGGQIGNLPPNSSENKPPAPMASYWKRNPTDPTKRLRIKAFSTSNHSKHLKWYDHLVGGWTNPFEKYESKWIISPIFGVKIKNIWNHHLVIYVIPAILRVSWPFGVKTWPFLRFLQLGDLSGHGLNHLDLYLLRIPLDPSMVYLPNNGWLKFIVN